MLQSSPPDYQAPLIDATNQEKCLGFETQSVTAAKTAGILL